MADRIDDALRQFKTGIEELLGHLTERASGGPAAFGGFEQGLFDMLGELGRRIEVEALESMDVEADRVGFAGQTCYWKYRGRQEYQTFLGKVEVTRNVYQANGENSICPLELNAGIHHHHLTPLAAEFVSYSSSHMVPRELAEFCGRWQFLKPCETTIKNVVASVGEFTNMLEEVYEDEVHQAERDMTVNTSVLAISRDGTMVNIRDEGWRQAEVGSIAHYDNDGARSRTTYVSRMPEEGARRFKAKLDHEIEHALENLPSSARIVCLADAALANWKYFDDHPRLKDAVKIADFFHAASHLEKAADALFGGTEKKKAKAWVEKHQTALQWSLTGVDQVIHSIRYYRSKLGKRATARRRRASAELRYFTRNRSRMQYAWYQLAGLPIGSGVVEAACKTVVGHRLKRAGMRWTRVGGQDILTFRTLVLSDRWDYFWDAHMRVLDEAKIAA